jgi:hypothetical protein
MARRKRDNTTADQLHTGDLIEPLNGHGYKARVTRISTSPNVMEPHVVVNYQWPDDFSVNANHRGGYSGHTYRPGDPVTRWLDPK